MSVMNPSTFLELTQRLFQECQLPGSGPTTVSGASGQTFDLFAWISQACKEIDELETSWSYLLTAPGVSFTTVAGQQIYTPTQAGVTVGDVSEWKLDTFRNYLTASGFPSEIEMSWMPYDDWLRTEQFGVLRTTQVRPMVFTTTPERGIALQCPLAGYTVVADYYRLPVPLETDGNEPLMPQRYRMAIVYKAMMAYGAEQNAPELYNEAERKYTRQLSAMRRSLLPTIRTCGALA